MRKFLRTLRALPKKELAGLVLLVIALPISLILAQKTQEIRKKAYELPLVTIVNDQGVPLPQKITDPNVYLLIRLPEGWELPPNEGPLFYNPIIKEARAQDGCATPENYTNEEALKNCSLSDLARLSNERLMTFDSGIIVQLPSSRLESFSNEQLIEVGKVRGDLPGFLNRFSNERLLNPAFPGHILSQLPASRIKTFSCDIQQQLGYTCSATAPALGGPSPSPIPTIPPTVTLVAQPSCSAPHDLYNKDHLDVRISQQVPDQGNNLRIWTTITDETSGFTGIALMASWGENSFVLHDNFNSIRNPIQMNFLPDTNYTVKVWAAPYSDNWPNLTTPLAQTSFSKDCPLATPSSTTSPDSQTSPPTEIPIPHTKLKEIIIENSDKGNATGGHEIFRIASNFRTYINKPVYWKLNDLETGQTEAARSILVKFIGSDSEYHTIAAVKLTQKDILQSGEIPAEVFIDNDFPNQSEMEQWSREAIDSHNKTLAVHNIKRAFRIEKITTSAMEPCWGGFAPPDNIPDDGKVRIFITKGYGGTAWPWLNLTCIGHDGNFDFNNTSSSKDILLHELGHILGLPDYYLQDIWDNRVVPIAIDSSVKDIMWHNDPKFDSNSREIINRMSNPLPEHVESWKYFSPKQVVLKILDDSGLPLPGAKVEVFPAVWKWESGSAYPRRFIPNVSSQEKTTDNTGQVYLGDQEALFKHNALPNYDYEGGTALIRVTHPQTKEQRYAALTLSYLNTLYFAYGQTNFATVSLPFSQLEKAPEPGKTKLLQAFSSQAGESSLNQSQKEELDRHVWEQAKALGFLKDLKPGDGTEKTTGAKSVSQQTESPETPQSTIKSLKGDIDKNGKVDIFDYTQLVRDLETKVMRGVETDLDGDGDVDLDDYQILIDNFGQTQQ